MFTLGYVFKTRGPEGYWRDNIFWAFYIVLWSYGLIIINLWSYGQRIMVKRYYFTLASR